LIILKIKKALKYILYPSHLSIKTEDKVLPIYLYMYNINLRSHKNIRRSFFSSSSCREVFYIQEKKNLPTRVIIKNILNNATEDINNQITNYGFLFYHRSYFEIYFQQNNNNDWVEIQEKKKSR
jgi:hypothetical protein